MIYSHTYFQVSFPLLSYMAKKKKKRSENPISRPCQRSHSLYPGGGSATAGIPHIVVTKKAVTGLRNLYTFSLKHFRKKKEMGKVQAVINLTYSC